MWTFLVRVLLRYSSPQSLALIAATLLIPVRTIELLSIGSHEPVVFAFRNGDHSHKYPCHVSKHRCKAHRTLHVRRSSPPKSSAPSQFSDAFLPTNSQSSLIHSQPPRLRTMLSSKLQVSVQVDYVLVEEGQAGGQLRVVALLCRCWVRRTGG